MQSPPPPPRPSVWAALPQALRHVAGVVVVGMGLATLFTAWTPGSRLFSPDFAANIVNALNLTRVGSVSAPTPAAPTAPPRPLPRIGVVAGHNGPQNDPGAVCPDGLTEASINLETANRVKAALEQAGFRVDLMNEFDDRLSDYRAIALVSIHSDSCSFINELATGFKVARALYDQVPERSDRLVACLTDRYKDRTGLNFHAGSITFDMTQYHGFNEIDGNTPAAIIELGFLNLDRDLLTSHPDLVAQGVAEGILCYARNEPVP